MKVTARTWLSAELLWALYVYCRQLEKKADGEPVCMHLGIAALHLHLPYAFMGEEDNAATKALLLRSLHALHDLGCVNVKPCDGTQVYVHVIKRRSHKLFMRKAHVYLGSGGK